MSRWLDAFRKVENAEDTPVPLGLKGAVSSNYSLSVPKRPNCTGASNRNHALDAEALPGSLQTARQLATPVDGCPDEWIEGVTRLIEMSCPDDISPPRWQILQSDTTQFLERWGVQAAALGWATCDVFGVNVVKPLIRLDGAGLVRLLNGRPVVAMTSSAAVIECKTSSRQTYRRKPPAVLAGVEQVLLWEISGPQCRATDHEPL